MQQNLIGQRWKRQWEFGKVNECYINGPNERLPVCYVTSTDWNLQGVNLYLSPERSSPYITCRTSACRSVEHNKGNYSAKLQIFCVRWIESAPWRAQHRFPLFIMGDAALLWGAQCWWNELWGEEKPGELIGAVKKSEMLKKKLLLLHLSITSGSLGAWILLS